MNRTMPIQIIDNWQVSIRPCELDHFAELFGVESDMKSNYREYQELMIFLTSTKMSLVDLVLSNDGYYDIDCLEKKDAMMRMFEDTTVALI